MWSRGTAPATACGSPASTGWSTLPRRPRPHRARRRRPSSTCGRPSLVRLETAIGEPGDNGRRRRARRVPAGVARRRQQPGRQAAAQPAAGPRRDPASTIATQATAVATEWPATSGPGSTPWRPRSTRPPPTSPTSTRRSARRPRRRHRRRHAARPARPARPAARRADRRGRHRQRGRHGRRQGRRVRPSSPATRRTPSTVSGATVAGRRRGRPGPVRASTAPRDRARRRGRRHPAAARPATCPATSPGSTRSSPRWRTTVNAEHALGYDRRRRRRTAPSSPVRPAATLRVAITDPRRLAAADPAGRPGRHQRRRARRPRHGTGRLPQPGHRASGHRLVRPPPADNQPMVTAQVDALARSAGRRQPRRGDGRPAAVPARLRRLPPGCSPRWTRCSTPSSTGQGWCADVHRPRHPATDGRALVVEPADRASAGSPRAQEQLSTGRIINRPSDSPTGTNDAMRLRAELARPQQYARNADDGIGWLGHDRRTLTVDARTASAEPATSCVQGASTGSTGPQAREALAVEVDPDPRRPPRRGQHDVPRPSALRRHDRRRRGVRRVRGLSSATTNGVNRTVGDGRQRLRST